MIKSNYRIEINDLYNRISHQYREYYYICKKILEYEFKDKLEIYIEIGDFLGTKIKFENADVWISHNNNLIGLGLDSLIKIPKSEIIKRLPEEKKDVMSATYDIAVEFKSIFQTSLNRIEKDKKFHEGYQTYKKLKEISDHYEIALKNLREKVAPIVLVGLI